MDDDTGLSMRRNSQDVMRQQSGKEDACVAHETSGQQTFLAGFGKWLFFFLWGAIKIQDSGTQ